MNASELLEAARQARRDGDMAECLLKASAAALAVDDSPKDVPYHAYACVGRVYLARDEPVDAVTYFECALATAHENGLIDWLAPAYHDLYIAGREAGVEDARQKWGSTAFRLYRDHSPRAPQITGLLADFAAESLSRRRDDHERASHCIEAWRAVPSGMAQPRYHLAACANIMFAAASIGSKFRYASADNALEGVWLSLPHYEHAARTLTHAGHAATMMKDYPRALELSERACTLSEGRGEHRVGDRARAVREAALGERVADL